MAEARSAIRVGGHATGVQLGIAEGHFDVHLRLKIPYRPSAIAVRVRRQLERLRNLVVNGSYPLGPLVLGILMLAIPSLYVTKAARILDCAASCFCCDKCLLVL